MSSRIAFLIDNNEFVIFLDQNSVANIASLENDQGSSPFLHLLPISRVIDPKTIQKYNSEIGFLIVLNGSGPE